MSKDFAIKIIDSMVDKNGHCGERGLSGKQFDILAEHLAKGKEYDLGEWKGDYKTVYFWGIDYEGNIGRYHVVINKHFRFHMGYNVVEISLRPAGEYEAELEAEAKLRAMRDFSGSEWVGEPKQRLDMSLTLVNDYEYEGRRYSYYDTSTAHIYTLRDDDGNCIVWRTKNLIYVDREDEKGRMRWKLAEVGSRVTMRATVKEHGEYRGIRQTVITRPKVQDIA